MGKFQGRHEKKLVHAFICASSAAPGFYWVIVAIVVTKPDLSFLTIINRAEMEHSLWGFDHFPLLPSQDENCIGKSGRKAEETLLWDRDKFQYHIHILFQLSHPPFSLFCSILFCDVPVCWHFYFIWLYEISKCQAVVAATKNFMPSRSSNKNRMRKNPTQAWLLLWE